MPMCPHCGSYISAGSPTCSCGASFATSSYEKEKDPEKLKKIEKANEWYRRGCELKRQGRYREALELLRKSRNLSNYGFSVYDEGWFLCDMGDYEGALEIFLTFKDNDNYGQLMAIGHALTKLGRYDEALDYYFKSIGSINRDSSFVPNYQNPFFGTYFTEEELEERAREKLNDKKRALSRVYAAIGLAYSYGENYKVAMKYADEAISFDGDNANNWNIRAIILEYMGKYGQSDECFKKAIELEDDNVFIENRARMLKRWCRELYDEDPERALKLIEEAIGILSSIQSDEDMGEYGLLRGEIRDRLDYDEGYDVLAEIGRENLFTLTGTYYCDHMDFEKGMVLNLLREPDNPFDGDAIAVYYCGRKVGYVANSPDTVSPHTTGASDLNIAESAYGEYVMEYGNRFKIARLR